MVADRLAEALGSRRRSFGGVVREHAIASGMSVDRASLQTLGESIIANEGWTAFCRDVVDDLSGEPVVVDGVRHIGAVDGLADLAAGGFLAMVFVDASHDVRATRVARRDGITRGDFEAAQDHPNEGELLLVSQRATLVVDNSTDGEQALDSIVRTIVHHVELIRSSRHAQAVGNAQLPGGSWAPADRL